MTDNKQQPSTYQPDTTSEMKRLTVQADFMAKFDNKLLQTVLPSQPEKPLTVLDVGCGEGTVTMSRFQSDRYGTIIGLDRNMQALTIAANKTTHDDRFHFIQVDADNETLNVPVENTLQKLGLEKVDIIFAAYSIHHLSNPVKVLQQCRNLLSPTGVMIIRTPDDDTDVAYPDFNNNFAKIIELTKNSPNVSDRQHGRKIYTQLYNAGFRDITFKYNIIDTVGLTVEEKQALFHFKFSYRADYLQKAITLEPDNITLREQYEEITERLKQFEQEFYQPDFFYNAVDFGVIAKNNS
jgi:SAM-dependent methyltransferase